MARQYKSQSWRNALAAAKSYIKGNTDYDNYFNKCYGFKRICRTDYNRLKTEYLLGIWK